MEGSHATVPEGYSYPATAAWFVAGAVVTALFSASLAMLARNAGLAEVLFVGMVVPSFTWVVQLSASGIALTPERRRLYWGDLGRVCLLGSVALLPAAIGNVVVARPALWPSAANVLASVALMGGTLFRLSARHGIPLSWPIFWCLTITVNMMLFVWSSWRWW